MKRETLFLKASLVLIGLPVLALCLFLVPALAKVAVKLVPTFPWIKYFVYLVFEASALPFYFALYQAFRLLVYIDRNDAFSEASVKALKTIKHCAVAICICLSYRCFTCSPRKTMLRESSSSV